jgi:hypothetical protein
MAIHFIISYIKKILYFSVPFSILSLLRNKKPLEVFINFLKNHICTEVFLRNEKLRSQSNFCKRNEYISSFLSFRCIVVIKKYNKNTKHSNSSDTMQRLLSENKAFYHNQLINSFPLSNDLHPKSLASVINKYSLTINVISIIIIYIIYFCGNKEFVLFMASSQRSNWYPRPIGPLRISGGRSIVITDIDFSI